MRDLKRPIRCHQRIQATERYHFHTGHGLPKYHQRFQLFEEFTGNNVNIFNQIENKENLFNLFIRKRLKVIRHGAFAVLKVIENYFSHIIKLAHLRTKNNSKNVIG